MECFTEAELTDIHLVYSAAYGNGGEAQRSYHKHFPNTVCPDYCMFAGADCSLWETGTFAVNRHSTGLGRSVQTLKSDEDVLQCIENNLSTSNHTSVTIRLNICYKLVRKTTFFFSEFFSGFARFPPLDPI